MQPSIVVIDQRSEPTTDDEAEAAAVTWQATRYLAAQVIANAAFPERRVLPKPRAPALMNFGHECIVDYDSMTRIVWQVAMEASAAVKRIWKPWRIAVVAALMIAYGVLAIWQRAPTPLVVIVAVLVGAALVAIMILYRGAAENAVADVRALALMQLAKDRFVEREPAVRVLADQIGTGGLGGSDVPVLTVTTDKRPFPGFGMPQGEQLFVCRPKPSETQVNIAELTPAILARVSDTMRAQPGVVLQEGEVVVVDGKTLSMDSNWLGPDKAPRLWLPRTELPGVADVDRRASARVFHASRLVLTNHASIATFFVRVYSVGNAIAFHIAVSALGPPRLGVDAILARVLKHRVDRARSWFDFDPKPPRSKRKAPEREAIAHLELVDQANRRRAAFQGVLDLENVKNLDPDAELLPNPSQLYKKLLGRVTVESVGWPGWLLSPVDNLREGESYSMTRDFFGRHEALALIRTVYDQVTRAVLETLDAAGFDISNYRDRDGRFTINVDQIGQLVVGEQVTMSQAARPTEAAVGLPSSQAGRAPTTTQVTT